MVLSKEEKPSSISKEEIEGHKKELIEIYGGYIKDRTDNSIKQRAQKLFIDYTYASGITERELMDGVWGLEHVGYDYGRESQKGEWKLNEEDAKRILDKLKKQSLLI